MMEPDMGTWKYSMWYMYVIQLKTLIDVKVEIYIYISQLPTYLYSFFSHLITADEPLLL